jgi:hypothetical protein
VKANKPRELSHPRLNEDRSLQSKQSIELRQSAQNSAEKQDWGLNYQENCLNSSFPFHNNLEFIWSLSSKELKILAEILS